MNMKRINIFIAAVATAFMVAFSGCSGFLDRDPDTIMTDDQIFGDAVMIKSVLAILYGRITWGQNVANYDRYTVLDEAAFCSGGPDTRSTFEDDLWRVYDYTLIRNINQFLVGLRGTKALSEADKAPLEGEARFIRAWTYFNMCRCMGGMPIVNDEVFNYTPGMDIETLQKPRSTEAEMYDYIISECEAIYSMLSADVQTHSARANKWCAKMLEARAAIYAGSLANYNNKMASPIKTSGGEVGIPADKAKAYYQKALDAANIVINSGKYKLQDNYANNKGRNFYEAVCVKDNNTEVIWARDYKYPGQTHGFTTQNLPKSAAQDIDNNYFGVLLNLVEQFEPINTKTPGYKSKIVTEENGTFKFYDSADAPFKDRDPRLWGTVIYPGATWMGANIVLQTGQLVKSNGEWTEKLSAVAGATDDNGILITSVNGPKQSNEQYINKTGFCVRKFLDETPSAGTRGRGSEMWFPRFRMAEAYMIACEASFELGDQTKALSYINAVRRRAGVQDLTTLTFDNIVHEDCVEFAFEDHRYWDLKRWRLADKIWNGVQDDEQARHRRLWPYLVVASGDPNNGKWVFKEDFLFMSPNARYFKMENYYNFINLSWINNNPKIVKNPYQ